jgi:uridine kinase
MGVDKDRRFPPQLCPWTNGSTFPVRLLREPHLRARRPKLSPIATADADSIVIVDGLFLHIPDMRSCWDYSVFIDADPEVCVRRALGRNQEGRADPRELERIYRTRYIPGFALYLREAAPQQVSSCVVHNSDCPSATGAG